MASKPDPTPGSMQTEVFVESSFQENAYVLWPAGEPACWIVDPSFPPQCDELCGFVTERRLTPQAILLTHAHADHIAGVDRVIERFPGIGLWIHPAEEELLGSAKANLSAAFGIPVRSAHRPTRYLQPGLELTLGPTRWLVLDTSGHSPGGISVHCPGAGLVIVGDALFAGSIGRYDFPHSDGSRLLANIRSALLSLPDETRVLPGHGPETTVGRERTSNPFLVE